MPVRTVRPVFVVALLGTMVLPLGSTHTVAQPTGERRARKATAPSPRLDVRTLMNQRAFRDSGLHKLDEAEIEALNSWLAEFAVGLLAEKQTARSGCAAPIETRIDGEFQGWTGDTVFKLLNGQIWKQTSYNYKYAYKYSPGVLIYKGGVGCKMKVDGVDGEISVERLK
jgi:hypothetical protein